MNAAVTAAELRDEDTGKHISRIGLYARRLSQVMCMPEEFVETVHYDILIESHARTMGILKGTTEVLTSHENYQFADYSKVNAAMFDVEARAKRRDEQFPVDCRKAFEMGARIASA